MMNSSLPSLKSKESVSKNDGVTYSARMWKIPGVCMVWYGVYSFNISVHRT